MIGVLRTPAGVIVCAQVIRGVPVDPVAPPVDIDPVRRDRDELTLWRNRPFVVSDGDGWSVHCLDGLRWIGPNLWGTGMATLDDAIDLAREAFLPRSPLPVPEQDDPDF